MTKEQKLIYTYLFVIIWNYENKFLLVKISPTPKTKKSPNWSNQPNQVRWELDSELRQINKNESTYASWETRYKGTYKWSDGQYQARINNANTDEEERVIWW